VLTSAFKVTIGLSFVSANGLSSLIQDFIANPPSHRSQRQSSFFATWEVQSLPLLTAADRGFSRLTGLPFPVIESRVKRLRSKTWRRDKDATGRSNL
jgi:hypothetical protein